MAESIPRKRLKHFGEKESGLTVLSEEEEQREYDTYEGKRKRTASFDDCEKEIPSSGSKQHIFDWANLVPKERMEKENPLVRKEFSFEEKSRPEALVITENWEEENPQVQREYSFEEKRRLKALLDGEEYDKWEKENRLWEIEDDLVPLNEDEIKQKGTLRLHRRIEQLNSKPLTEEEERIKQSYLENVEKSPGSENWEQENPLVRKVFSFEERSRPELVITENWEEENPQVQREYSFEEKRRLKSLVHGEGFDKWEKQNRLWETEYDLVPLKEDEKKQKGTLILRRRIEQLNSRPLTKEEERLKQSYLENVEKSPGSENWEQDNPLVRKVFSFEEKSRPELVITENWEEENPQVQREYSFEEKRRLKALVHGEEYDKWEKQNRLWEIEHDLVPLKFRRRIELLNSRPLTEEEERLKQSYLENVEKSRLGLPTGSWNPNGPGWELAFYTGPDNLLEAFRKAATHVQAPAPLEERQTAPLTPAKEHSTVSSCVISTEETTEEKREKLAAQGRCLIGSYLTPYCQCNSHCRGGNNIPSDEYPPEVLPIWLAFSRQCRQSHCFDIDEFPGKPLGVVYFGAPLERLEPSQDFNGKAELLMELANRAIEEYNAKECNVFKYKVKKIEKVNCSLSRYHQYWMTVKVFNLTLGTPIETFQIHAGIACYGDDKKIYCCRLKEEAIVGLPSCDFCFGLLSEGHVTGRKE